MQKGRDLTEKKLDVAATQPPRYSSSKATGTETKVSLCFFSLLSMDT